MISANSSTKSHLRNRTKRPAKHISCYLCDGFSLITECHHLFSVSNAAIELNETGKTFIHTVWLCPNCHSYWHKLEHSKTEIERLAIWNEIGIPISHKMVSLQQEALEAYSRYTGIEIPEDIE